MGKKKRISLDAVSRFLKRKARWTNTNNPGTVPVRERILGKVVGDVINYMRKKSVQALLGVDWPRRGGGKIRVRK